MSTIEISDYSRILEPSFGDGSFLDAVLQQKTPQSESSTIDQEIVGIEIDPELAAQCVARLSTIETEAQSATLYLYQMDFFHAYLQRALVNGREQAKNQPLGTFDLILGNPPFGGTFDHAIEDDLDATLGKRLGLKIKKETYSFFIVACIDLLRQDGRLLFVCSDTLLTIPTMKGLRQYLMESGNVTITSLESFSEETTYPMVLLDFVKTNKPGYIIRDGKELEYSVIQSTPNLSWGITDETAALFNGPLMSEYFVASSGMTTGKNEYFVREVTQSGSLQELYEFVFYEAPVSVEYERERARLGKLPAKRIRELSKAEQRGDTEVRLKVTPLATRKTVALPCSDYKPYNKANSKIIFSEPTHYIYWKDDGRAVLTYKRTGNWYLRGVGGRPFFEQEAVTWQLVASRFVPRFLPEGYILDSGAPCAFVKEGVDRDELFFALGWLLSPLATKILKTVINHTRNIQSKDFERMPYPWWLDQGKKSRVISTVRSMIQAAKNGRTWNQNDPEVLALGSMFEPSENITQATIQAVQTAKRRQPVEEYLFT